MTKPQNGPKLREATGAHDINVEEFFAEILNYKTEFAFNLMSTLRDEDKSAEEEDRSPKKFFIPNYISQAFDFIKGR